MTDTFVLFVCNSNCARSKIAEGFGSDPSRSRIMAHSAGINPGLSVNPLVAPTLASFKVKSKALILPAPRSLDSVPDNSYHYVVFLCDCSTAASLRCSKLKLRSGGKVLKWKIIPPSKSEGGFEEATRQIEEAMVAQGWLVG